ncbi:hypothetical protein, partial [Microbacterium sp.]|uniref:hypothetical protein n=1 Tax=Microbacterium sp. TaxID=51671 RepID=UPI003C78FB68
SVVAGAASAPHGTPVAVATGTVADPAAPIDLAGTGGDGVASYQSESSGGAQSRGTEAMTADSAAVSPWHYSNSRRFTAPPFDSAASRATVYALDAATHYSAADAERIAHALGMAGTAHSREHVQGWFVGADDEADRSGPQLQLWLMPSGGADVSYSGGFDVPWMECWAAITPKDDPDAESFSQEQLEAAHAEAQSCVAATPVPTEQQARDALSLFLAATGVEESETQVTVTPDDAGRTTTATAARVVAGNVTVVTSTVTVSAKGLLEAHGSNASIVSLGEYDIVSPAEAAERMNDPVFAPAYASKRGAEIDDDQYPDAPTEPPATPGQGAPVPWGITEFEISSARLGLAMMVGTDDTRFLAPAYEFTDTEGNVWSVLAVAESQLETTGGGDRWWGWWGGFW